MVEPLGHCRVSGAVRAMDFLRSQTGQLVLAIAVSGGAVYRIQVNDESLADRALAPLGPAHQVWDLVHVPRPTGWPDLATVSADDAVRIYDLDSGTERPQRRPGRPDELRVIETLRSPDGSSMIAAAGLSTSVYLWRGDATEPIELPGHIGAPRVLKALRDECWLAVADERGIVVWDVGAVQPVRKSLCPGRSRSIGVMREHGIVLLAAATADGIRLWDPKTGQQAAHFGYSLNVTSVAVFDSEEDEQMLAVVSDEGVSLWNPATEGRSLTQLTGVPDGTLKMMARISTGNGTLLAVGDERGAVAVWRLRPQRRITNLVGQHTDWVNDLSVVRSTRRVRLASASDDHTARLWEPGRGQHGPPMHHGAQVHAIVAVGGDLITGDQQGHLRRWSDAGAERWAKATGYGPIRAMTAYCTEDRWRVVSGGGGGHCALWDAGDGSAIKELRPPNAGHNGAWVPSVRALAAFQHSHRWYVVAGDLGGGMVIWDAETGQEYWSPQIADRPLQVRSLAFVPATAQALLASGDSTGTIRLWDIGTRRLVRIIANAHAGPVSTLCPIYDGQDWLLVSGGADRDLRLWDPESPDDPFLDEHINAHDSWVRALVHVPSAASLGSAVGEPIESEPNPLNEPVTVASGGEEGYIRLWQVRDGRLVRSTRYRSSIRGFRDRVATFDLLDRDAITEELFALLEPSIGVADGTATGAALDTAGGPQVVLIQGDWGTGKSSLMRQLEARLRQAPVTSPPRWWHRLDRGGVLRRFARGVRRRWLNRELSPAKVSRISRRGSRPDAESRSVARTATVWFNPWTHQSSNQVWSGLAWSIVSQTRDQLSASEAERQRYWLSRNLDRLDRGVLRRTIRHRIWRPAYAVLAALLVPLALSLSRADLAGFLPGGALGTSGEAPWAGLVFAGSATIVLLTVGYAIWQYYFGHATAHLPAALFDGPVDQATLNAATGEPLSRDPAYFSAAGQLHRINEDVQALTTDLSKRGYQLAVFIDDLDRCTAPSTVAMLEAINALLSAQRPTDPAPRFVIGLDTAVVANQLANELAGNGPSPLVPHSEDPNVGWSMLRKLSQLTVVLPGVRPAHSTRLLRLHNAGVADAGRRCRRSPAPVATPRWSPRSRPTTEQPVASALGNTTSASRSGDDQNGFDQWVRRGQSGPRRATANWSEQQFTALEGEPDIQAHLRKLISLRPRQTMRETKRLLTLWSFYMRLLGRLLPPEAIANTRDACDVLTLAEIMCRWPAYVRYLGGDGTASGLAVMIEATAGGGDDAAWRAALANVGLSAMTDEPATDNLRRLLHEYGNDRVATFAEVLL